MPDTTANTASPVTPGPATLPSAGTLPPPSISIGAGSSITQAQVDSARERWIADGRDGALFDNAVFGTPLPTTGDTPAPAASAVPTGVEFVKNGVPRFTASQANDIANKLVDAGVDPEKVKAALIQDGFTLADPADDETPAEVEHNARYGMDAHDPSEYKLDLTQAPSDPALRVQFNTNVTQVLSEMHLPPAMGQMIAERAVEVAKQLDAMNDTQRALWEQEQKIAGGTPEQYAATTEAAKSALLLAPASPFMEGLLKSGVLHDHFLRATLANWGQHVAEWKAGYPK